jgi:hypothetical protein
MPRAVQMVLQKVLPTANSALKTVLPMVLQTV